MPILENYSKIVKKPAIMLIVIPAWVVFCFFSAQLATALIFAIVKAVGLPILAINESVLTLVSSALIYVVTLAMVVGLPWLVGRKKVSRQELGLGRSLSWLDMLIAPAGFVVYAILATVLIMLASKFLPWFNVDQVQDTGFNQINQRFEYILAFITLVIIAPLAEEILFRGYLFSKLKKYVPIWLSIIVVSLVFGVLHGAWNLAFDTFALSVILCLLRELTGSLWASILLHMIKNGIAFFMLFIYPIISATIR